MGSAGPAGKPGWAGWSARAARALVGLAGLPPVLATSLGGARTAAALARAINHAPTMARGAIFNCPDDDGTGAWLTFSDADRRTSARLDVSLSGCRLMNAPGTLRRTLSSGVRNALATLAPCGWKTYLGDSSASCVRSIHSKG